MQDPLTASLVVTGLGMLILFAAMALLYGLMVAMTALIRDRATEEASPPGGTGESGRKDRQKLRAAVIAVGLARAELEWERDASARARTAASPWRQYHHQRLLNHPRDRGTCR
jgi:Na+-transporting methylmalonyl-CoA/oxaloacetate decarboxylase gamma subunit